MLRADGSEGLAVPALGWLRGADVSAGKHCGFADRIFLIQDNTLLNPYSCKQRSPKELGSSSA